MLLICPGYSGEGRVSQDAVRYEVLELAVYCSFVHFCINALTVVSEKAPVVSAPF